MVTINPSAMARLLRLAIKEHRLGEIAQESEVGDVAGGLRSPSARLAGRAGLRLKFALEGVLGGQRVAPPQCSKRLGQAGTLTRRGFGQLACELFDCSTQPVDLISL